MTFRLRLFEEAAEKVEHERHWYRKRSEFAEASFRELDNAVAAVLDSPHMWPQYIAGTRRYVFPMFPFSLVYFVENDVVLIVSIAADQREPGYWRDRLPRRE